MNVLFIGKRFYTNRDALLERFGRIYQLPRHWARSGNAVRLWLVDYHRWTPASASDDGLQVASTPVRTLGALRTYLSESRRSGDRDPRPGIIVASGDCYIGLMGYRLARRLGARFVFDVYDKYDEFGGYLRPPFFDPFRFLLRGSDARLFASRALMEKLGCTSARDFLVPNGIDTQRFRPLDMSSSRSALGVPQQDRLVGYFGSMDEDRGIDDLLEAHRRLRASGLDVGLMLGGRSRPGLDLQRPGVRYLGNLPHAEVPRAMACCDVLVLPYRRSPYLDMASSCKIAEYIAMQRPLVATRTPNVTQNFADQVAGLEDLLAIPGDPDDLARAIRAQFGQRRLVRMPEGFDWAAIAGRLATDLGFG